MTTEAADSAHAAAARPRNMAGGAGRRRACSSSSPSPSPPSSSGRRPTRRCRARSSERCMSASCFFFYSGSSPTARRRSARHAALFWALGVIGFVVGLYHWFFYTDLLLRAGDPNDWDIAVGVVAVVARLRRRAADDGMGAADHLRALPRLWPLRSASAVAAQSSRLRFLADHRHALPRHRRHLRHADLRLLDLHLPVHPLRRVPGARRHDRPLHRRRAWARRAQPRRAGEGRRRLLCADGDDQRLGRRQRRHHRAVHDSLDEALRLQARLRRRRRGDIIDGRADHAAGDGGGRLHHGRDARRALPRGGEGGDRAGRPLFRHRLHDGASRSRAAWTGRHPEGRVPERARGTQGEVAPDPAARGARLAALLRLYAALRRDGRVWRSPRS